MADIKLMLATWLVEKALGLIPVGFPGRIELSMAHLTICRNALARGKR